MCEDAGVIPPSRRAGLQKAQKGTHATKNVKCESKNNKEYIKSNNFINKTNYAEYNRRILR